LHQLSDPELLEFYKQHRAGQDKYAYFLLAVVASAIAFTVNKTTGLKVTCTDIPLGFAVACWGLSFYFGCKYIEWCQTAIYSNFSLLQLKKGVHPQQPQHTQEMDAAIRGVTSALESNSSNAGKYSKLQFNFAIAGALMFLIWHGIKVYLFTNVI
jgi:hypothetical protein